jgi:hypothetical protein
MQFMVRNDRAVSLVRPRGANITVINQSGTIVYADSDPNRLNGGTIPTGVPSGTALAAAGGEIQFTDYPGIWWFRAAAETTVEVQP